MIKKERTIYSVNSLYLIFGKKNGYFEENDGNKNLTLVSTNEKKKKKKIKKYDELWIEIRNLIRPITKNLDDYDEKYMKIECDSDGNLPLNKTIEIPIVTMAVRGVFHENNKYYQQVFLDECLYKIYSKNELKEIDIKNRVFSYFDNIIEGTKIN